MFNELIAPILALIGIDLIPLLIIVLIVIILIKL